MTDPFILRVDIRLPLAWELCDVMLSPQAQNLPVPLSYLAGHNDAVFHGHAGWILRPFKVCRLTWTRSKRTEASVAGGFGAFFWLCSAGSYCTAYPNEASRNTPLIEYALREGTVLQFTASGNGTSTAVSSFLNQDLF